MSKRTEHTFQFTAEAIADAAHGEAAYHQKRLAHWQERAEEALKRVKETIGAKVVETEVTGGTQATVQVDYGDKASWNEYTTARGKIERHRGLAERFHTDAQVYGSQTPTRTYELDADDVHHFRLGGQDRED